MSYVSETRTGYGPLHWIVAALLALALLVLWLMGCGPGGSKCGAAPAAVVPASVAVAPAPAVVSPAPMSATATAPAATAPAVASVPAATAPAVASVPAVTPPVASASEWARVETIPAAKVYFGLDKIDLPATTDKTLAGVVAYLKKEASAKAYVSGYHDPTGDQAHNTDLANNRASQVVGALGKLGISEDRVVIQKPSVTTGTGTHSEARRVEVTVWAQK